MDASGPMEWRAFLSVQCENSSSTLNRGIGRTIAKKLSGKRLGNQWQFATVNRTRNRKKALRPSLRSRKRPIDGHLAGLLTYASMNLKRLPGSSRPFTPNIRREMGTFPVACCSGSQRIQLRGSGGFSPRFPLPDGRKLYENGRQGQAIW
jgi:hypothetical protein